MVSRIFFKLFAISTLWILNFIQAKFPWNQIQKNRFATMKWFHEIFLICWDEGKILHFPHSVLNYWAILALAVQIEKNISDKDLPPSLSVTKPFHEFSFANHKYFFLPNMKMAVSCFKSCFYSNTRKNRNVMEKYFHTKEKISYFMSKEKMFALEKTFRTFLLSKYVCTYLYLFSFLNFLEDFS